MRDCRSQVPHLFLNWLQIGAQATVKHSMDIMRTRPLADQGLIGRTVINQAFLLADLDCLSEAETLANFSIEDGRGEHKRILQEGQTLDYRKSSL